MPDLHVTLLYETKTTPDLYKILRQVFCTLHSYRLFFFFFDIARFVLFIIPVFLFLLRWFLLKFHSIFFIVYLDFFFYVSFMFSFRVFFCCHRSTILTFHDNLSLSVIVSKSFLYEWLFFFSFDDTLPFLRLNKKISKMKHAVKYIFSFFVI